MTSPSTKLQPKTISQHKLRRFLELQKASKEFDDIKKEIIKLAQDGLPCQPGPLSCSVKVTPTTIVPWKDEFISAVGQDEADRILEANKGNRERKSLVVTDRDNPTG